MNALAVALGALAVLVAVSYLIEGLRPQPTPPARLSWAPQIPIRWVSVNGVKIRYLIAGDGPTLVLLHTLRTQLDMFQRIVPVLAGRFGVVALGYPGHGYSDIPDASYSADYFTGFVGSVLDQLAIEPATIVAESIGGTIALLLAARRHPRLSRVLSVNPYDYGAGRGLRRSSLIANLLFGVNDVPLLGATVERLRLYPIVKRVFEGGVANKDALPSHLAREMNRVGNRRGHYQALMRLVHEWPSWERARTEYGNIRCPVLLLYGERDWSRPAEREANARDIPGAEMRTVPGAGHFLSLDAPKAIIDAVDRLTSSSQPGAPPA